MLLGNDNNKLRKGNFIYFNEKRIEKITECNKKSDRFGNDIGDLKTITYDGKINNYSTDYIKRNILIFNWKYLTEKEYLDLNRKHFSIANKLIETIRKSETNSDYINSKNPLYFTKKNLTKYVETYCLFSEYLNYQINGRKN